MSKKIFKLSLILLFAVFILSACTLPWKKKPNSPNNSINQSKPGSINAVNPSGDFKKFANYDELKSFLQENSLEGGVNYGSMSVRSDSFGGKTMAPQAAESMVNSSLTTAGDSGASSGAVDYSGTNNQVAGVDEADIIKTDGTYIYALVRNDLYIIKAVPGQETATLSKITFKSRPQDILLNGKSLAVFGSDDQIFATDLYRTFKRQSNYTFFKVFDLSDPTKPQQVRDLDFEGSYADARLIGNYVYFFTNTYTAYLEGESLVPRILDNGQAMPYSPDVFYFDIPYNSYNYTSATAINLTDNTEAINGQVYLMDSGQNLYVSPTNIYLTYTEYLNEYDIEQDVKRILIYPKLSADDQGKITQIEAVPNFVLNKNEKKIKVSLIIDRYIGSLPVSEADALQIAIDGALKQKLTEKAKDMEKTIIHKISISDNKIEYKAKGEVIGQVLNQFSMDESGGYFRLATTRSQTWSRLAEATQESYSNVYVLDANLKIVGRLENLATKERIYAARFMGGRVYLVTFRQTDPLYAISLSDPANPKVLGAIKIPGFSSYLHPVDKDGTKLLGIGRDAEDNGEAGVKVKGLKISLFDFSDLAKPKELDTYLVGDANSDSIALYDHHAFLYSEAKNLLVVPAVLRDSSSRLSFAGALVFNINNDKLVLKGRIDHSAGFNSSQADYWNGFSYYDNTVKRSLYINDNLYTFSNKFLKVNSLVDLKEQKSLLLTSGGDDYIITPTPLGDSVTAPDQGSAPSSQGIVTGDTAASAPAINKVSPTLPTDVGETETSTTP